MTHLLRLLACAAAAAMIAGGLTGCATPKDTRNKIIVSVRDQRMLLVHDDKPVKTYKVSTSKYGVGDFPGSYRTPLGRMEVAKKIGSHAPKGAVFKHRRRTGEVLKPNSPGRDPIVTRIIWLRGKESCNRRAFRRFIYIHGTPEEWRLGRPASYGCIRMASRDIVDLYRRIGVGAEIRVVRGPLVSTSPGKAYADAQRKRDKPEA